MVASAAWFRHWEGLEQHGSSATPTQRLGTPYHDGGGHPHAPCSVPSASRDIVQARILRYCVRMPLHLRILTGFLVGAILGVAAHALFGADHGIVVKAATFAEPVGKLFLRALLVVVVPLVASSLVCGVMGLGDLRKLGRVGGKTLVLTVALSSISVVVSAVANVVRRVATSTASPARHW